jgi:hypothetical protein
MLPFGCCSWIDQNYVDAIIRRIHIPRSWRVFCGPDSFSPCSVSFSIFRVTNLQYFVRRYMIPFYPPPYSVSKAKHGFSIPHRISYQSGLRFFVIMLPTSGRPRKACGICKSQKVLEDGKTSLCAANTSQIRCSGERPLCRRCSRLGHTCIYGSKRPSARENTKPTQASASLGDTDIYPSPTSVTAREGIHILSDESAREERSACVGSPVRSRNTSTASNLLLDDPEEQDHYLGVPKALISTLIQVYYDNVYNATLLFHKASFLQSVAAGTVRPHVVLSVCAWAAKYAIIASHTRGYVLTMHFQASIEMQSARLLGGITVS